MNKSEKIQHKATDNVDEQKFTHPAFGMISHSRVSGGDMTLAGSDLRHNQSMVLRVHSASIRRSFHSERFYQEKILLEVSMSEQQWATFLSSGNSSGVPCTINTRSEETAALIRVPKIEPESAHDKTVDELRDCARNIVVDMQKELAGLEVLVNKKGSVSKAALREKIKALSHAVMKTVSNIPFVVECHQEVLEKNVQAAKSEVEGYVTQKIYDLGLTELEKQAPVLFISKGIEVSSE